MEPWVLPVFLVFFVAQFGIETALLVVNLRHVASARGVPPALAGAVDATTAERSREYTLANGRLGLVEGLGGGALTLVVLLSGVLPWLDGVLARAGLGGAHRFVAFLGVLAIASSLVWMPFGLWRTFVLEARFGFNRTTPRVWVVDRVKALAVEVALGVPLL